MNRKKSRFVVWSMLLAIGAGLALVGGMATSAAAEEDPRIRAYQEQLDRMQKEMDDMRARLRALEDERHGAKAGRAAQPAATTPPAVQAPPAAAAAASTAPAVAAKDSAEQDRKIGVLATEVERLKSAITLPENKELKSLYGLGPAASKVYQIEHGLSLGGYGEFSFQKLVSDKNGGRDTFDLQRFVLYTGYKFTDRILLNSELEFEHAVTASDKEGEVEVEFLNLDFLAWEQLNFRAGLLLVPMGFVNEIHEPPFRHGVERPEVEQRIIPTTWREGGVGVFGTLAPGLDYRAYLLNGLTANGFTSDGIREGRQEGSLASINDIAGTARLDYTLWPGSLVGASFWAGNSGQGDEFANRHPGVFTLVWETHAQVHYRGLELRALGAFTHIDDTALVSRQLEDTIGKDQYGFYVEAAYDLVPVVFPDAPRYLASLAPFFRYENFDTQDSVPRGFMRVPGKAVQLYTVGLDYKPHPQVALKFEYRNFDAGNVQPKSDELNFGAGFAF
jgi:hypothetical protein